jgi:predicted metal-binding protein
MSDAIETELNEKALDCGAFKTASMKVSDIPFRREFREACKINTCGKYGKNWMCPPEVGDIDELIAKASGYQNAFILQSVGTLEDSFDIEGMQEAGKNHCRMLQAFFSNLPPSMAGALKLSAGTCKVCDGPCAKTSDEPCRFPEKAMASMEAYGIAVSELAECCGLEYVNGMNTITYFGALLYNLPPQ